MNLFRKVLVGVLGLALCHASPETHAGDGFPPNGAWVYGSRPYGYSHHGYSRHRQVGHVRSVGWSGYGLGGYGGGYGLSGYSSVRYRAHYGGWYGHRSHYSAVVRGFHPVAVWNPVHSWNWCGPSVYSSFRTGYYFPSHPLYYGGLPVYSSYYVAPSMNFTIAPYCDAAIANPGTFSFSASLPASVIHGASQVQLADYSTYGVGDYGMSAIGEGSVAAPVGVPYLVAKPSLAPPLIRGDEVVEVPVQLVSQLQESQLIPEAILTAADDIFRAGGYREAATAYAQLAVRYGSSELLYTRRFLAQVASGDMEQAIVVASTAELAGMQVSRNTLPGGSLSGLGLDEDTIAAAKEALAAHAYQVADDADALFAMAGWLHLAKDDERAELFLARARQLTNAAATPKNEPKIM